MTTAVRLPLLLAGGLVVAASLAAQAPADRAALSEFRGTLGATRDTATVFAMERGEIDVARADRSNPIEHLRLGFIALRLGDLTAKSSHYRDAAGEFEWATRLQPDWPLPWFGLGLAELADEDAAPGIRRIGFVLLGFDADGAAERDLARSAEVDSTFTDGLLSVANLAFRQWRDVHIRVALGALRRLANAPVARSSAYLLARGRLEREAGQFDSARVSLEQLLARDPDNPAGLLEYARTRFGMGALEAKSWYRGLELADTATLAEYDDDLSRIVPDSVLRIIEGPDRAARVTAARRFWEDRAGADLRSPDERLREHYLRLDFVWRNLIVRPDPVYGAPEGNVIPRAWYDDRGLVYLKHGPPDATSSVAFAGVPSNESWAYHLDDGTDLIFHFVRFPGAPGYRTVESLFDILSYSTAARVTHLGFADSLTANGSAIETYGAGWVAQTAEELLSSRDRLSPIYDRIILQGKRGATALQAEERAMGIASIKAPDSWSFRYEVPLEASVDVLSLGATPTGGTIQMAFAVSGAALHFDRSRFGYIYPVRLRASVLDPAGHLVARLDTTRDYVSHDVIAPGQYLLGRFPLAVPPGSYTVRYALETTSRGKVGRVDSLLVRPPETPRLTISDLALGTRPVQLSWATAPGDTAWVNPLHSFRRKEELQLYFEVAGLSAGSPYQVELAISDRPAPADAEVREHPLLRIAFDARRGSGVDRIRRGVDLKHLGTGTYYLRVTLTTPTGVRVTRQREFRVDN